MLRHFAEGAFSSKHLNLLNLHLGIVSFGQVLRLSVNVVFFHTLGFSAAQICIAMGVLIGGRFILRTPLIFIPHKFGTKPALILGQLMLAVAFGMYSAVSVPGPLLWAAIGLMSAGEALYWHAFHTTFATLAQHGKFGRQLAARSIFMGVGGLLAPLTAGIIAGAHSWHMLFILACSAVVLSIVPLFFMPEPCPPRPMEWKKGMSINKAGMRLYIGWGAVAAYTLVIWPLIVFLEMGTVEKYGALMTLTMILSMGISIFMGRRVDLGKGKDVLVYTGIAYTTLLLMLTAFGRDALSITLLSMGLQLTSSVYVSTYGAALYRWAKETNDPLWFHYWSEFGWDIGNALTLFSAAAILTFDPDVDLRWMVLLALPAILWCHYVYFTDASRQTQQEVPA